MSGSGECLRRERRWQRAACGRQGLASLGRFGPSYVRVPID
ncbi:hypothetical protein [Alloactinosynnema sp. L-07]|nr:hypothetical protein [Alloactinosynnema sp. L-07]